MPLEPDSETPVLPAPPPGPVPMPDGVAADIRTPVPLPS
jgi:hypothetical protein